MKNFLKKLLGTLFFQILSIFILFGIAFAAISIPNSTPSGETAGGKITNMLTSCGNGQYLAGYNSDFTKNCKAIPDTVPKNAVMAFYTANCPTGWKFANGGNGTPDLRGVFIRGLDSGRGLDYGRTLGSYQGDAIRNITGAFFGHAVGRYNWNASGVFYNMGNSGDRGSAGHGKGGKLGFDASLVVPTTPDDTRPKNVALIYCVKE